MQGCAGRVIADYGFNFFEKIHEPIFLMDRQGHIKRLNESARKFLKVTHINLRDLEAFACSQIEKLFPIGTRRLKRIRVGSKNMTVIARNFENSGLLLVEVKKACVRSSSPELSSKDRWSSKISHWD